MFDREQLHGVMAMMPAFGTDDADKITTKMSIDVDRLRAGVNRMVGDGANVITTTGSFGECHTLFFDEFKVLAKAALDTVDSRVPLFIGCTSVHTRETLKKMEYVHDIGGQGVLVGLPYYEPAKPDNIVQFYHDIADSYPEISIMIYHNPDNHKVHIPVDCIRRIVAECPNVMAMKDSHRTPQEFMRMMDVTNGKLNVFVNFSQLYPYALFGAKGCWSIDSWLGPWPLLALRDAVFEDKDYDAARDIIRDLTSQKGGRGDSDGKLAMRFAGYCDPGPNRPPFRVLPDRVVEGSKKKAEFWNQMCDKYRPRVEARRTVAAGAR